MIRTHGTRVMVALLGLLLWGAGQVIFAAPPDRETLEQAYRPRRLALVIGINEFRDSRWRGLHYAGKDAADMSAALRDPERGGFDLVIELTEPWQTTKVAIHEAFNHLDDKNMSTEDTVVIYISTHGTLARDEDYQLHQYLVAYDTAFDNVRETAIEMGELVDELNRLTSRRKVMIMACCHSGMGKSELPEDVASELSLMKAGFFVKPVEFASEASMIIGVCSWGETAREDEALENDIYTHFFLEGMTMYDRNQDGAVSVSEAHDYAQRKTYYYTSGTQRPFARSDVLGTDPIILTGKVMKTGLPMLLSYSGQLDGAMVSINGQEKGRFPEGFTTTPGWNHIRTFNRDGEPLLSSLLYVRQGEQVDADRLMQVRAEPRTGLAINYRMLASEELSEIVLPGMAMYGLAYRIGAFPTANTSVHLETTYGHNQWNAHLDHDQARMSVDIMEANVALLYSYRRHKTDLFGGPLVGAYAMLKQVEIQDRTDNMDSGTMYPGLMGGIRLRSGSDLNFEISDRLSYHFLTVEGKQQGTLVNEVAATVYFSPRTIISDFRSNYQGWRWGQASGLETGFSRER
ncbi:MAG TPA: caspase family protein [bacterium]|nr:caspase family protein [bacterium]